MDDYNIKKHQFVRSSDLSKRSVPATEHGSFVSKHEWYALDQHGKHSSTSLIRMALNNNCGLKC